MEKVRKAGRPKKALIDSKTKGKRNALGRPKGDAAAINEFKARLLASPKSRKVIDSIFDAALDNEHKNQSAAWKILVERIMPLSYFDKANNSSGKASVNISITNVDGSTNVIGEEIPEEEITDVEVSSYEKD